MKRLPRRRLLLVLSLAVLVVIATGFAFVTAAHAARAKTVVMVPEEDRFEPAFITVKAGGFVRWVNSDEDGHTIVSDDFFNTTGQNHHVDMELPGTEDNGGQPTSVTLNFGRPGIFVYYCRFHAHLDDAHQPVAPGPEGGIQDANGNFGTPMMGVVVVLPGNA